MQRHPICFQDCGPSTHEDKKRGHSRVFTRETRGALFGRGIFSVEIPTKSLAKFNKSSARSQPLAKVGGSYLFKSFAVQNVCV